uniref:Uncharacterized protein n=1 Tax=Arundo donax TaxID=35708 RepID=A0A0A9GH46_ARUDO
MLPLIPRTWQTYQMRMFRSDSAIEISLVSSVISKVSLVYGLRLNPGLRSRAIIVE